MSLSVVTPPYADPLSLAEARLHIKSDETTDDALITGAIAAVRDFAQHETGRQLVAARLRQTLDCFPECDEPILLLRAPVLAVVSIVYTASDGTVTTLAADQYQTDLNSIPARIAPAYGVTWPYARESTLSAVTVTFDVGHAGAITAADTAANTITVRGLPAKIVGDVLRVTNSGGALPAPLAANTDYYVQSVVSPNVYTLSATSGGAAIDLTTAGTGQSYVGEVPEGIKSWMKLRLGSLDLHREDVGAALQPLPFIDRLLDPHKVYGV